MPFFRPAAGECSFVPRAVRFWNDRLESLANKENVTRFKAEMKKLFLEALFFLIFKEVYIFQI